MEKFQLSLLFKIIGIGSASGLVYHEDHLYVISDNSTYLYEYQLQEQKLHKIPLTENAQDNIPKKDKPDFEAIAREGNDLFVLGSGSTQNRNRLYKYRLKSQKITEKDLTKTYQDLKSKLGITDSQLNIEGLIVTDTNIYLFQRGNGADAKNGIIVCSDDENPDMKFVPFDLPKIKNVESTFTDAVLVDQTIYFLATAEDTQSTYDDGEVLGSLIGTIDLPTMKMGFTTQITHNQKFEGLTLYKKTASGLEFLLCEDKDTALLESGIYSLKLEQ